jgi:hypothetical protein
VSVLTVVTPAKYLKATSSLVRRLIHPHHGSAKKRICHWLSDIGEMQLLQFGVTLEEIAILRREREAMCGSKMTGIALRHIDSIAPTGDEGVAHDNYTNQRLDYAGLLRPLGRRNSHFRCRANQSVGANADRPVRR